MGFPRQEYWSGLPLPNPMIEPVSLVSLVLAGRFFTTTPTREALLWSYWYFCLKDLFVFFFKFQQEISQIYLPLVSLYISIKVNNYLHLVFLLCLSSTEMFFPMTEFLNSTHSNLYLSVIPISRLFLTLLDRKISFP